jgi:ComF family protein
VKVRGFAAVQSVARTVIDFALPPRCGGCGTIVADVGLFCTNCWSELDLRSPGGGCACCGQTLAPTEMDRCLACIADPRPVLDRVRHAVPYGEIASKLVLQLKYGRKVAMARTLAGYMARSLGELTPGALLVPVPLHRRRLWSRGFNQSALIARSLARRSGQPIDVELLQRLRNTPPLKGMNRTQRQSTVDGAFALRAGKIVRGRAIVLVDDVITTGSTARACAKVLRKHGATSVELLAWARVER